MEKVKLKVMSCPECGGKLKIENDKEQITCLYCDNVIVPVVEPSTAAQNESGSGGFSGTLKVEGIKTPSSALAYIEQLFEDYDWDAFAYVQTLTVTEVDKLTDSLKFTSADDKKTWFACFKAIYVPFACKINGCKKILDSVVEEYKKDNFEAYSKFDAYKRVSAMIVNNKNSIVANLEKIVAKAEKYGATTTEISDLKEEIDAVRERAVINAYNSIEDIPQIKAFNEEKNAKIIQSLAANGIDAESEYLKAKSMLAQRNYVEALNILVKLNGYADSNAIIEQIDKYYLIFDALEIEGKLYYYQKSAAELNTYNLYPAENGKILEKPIIKNIGHIITNYADILYYLDGNGKLRKYNFATMVVDKLDSKSFQSDSICVYKRRAFLVSGSSEGKSSLTELNLSTGEVKPFLENVSSIVPVNGNKINDNKIVYKTDSYSSQIGVVDVDTKAVTTLKAKKISIKGFVDNFIVYTQQAPNKYNYNLYIKSLNSEEPEKLIEKNIFEFSDIIAGKLFYYIGNSKYKTLININLNGTERKEWPSHISKVLFEQGGWLYFIRKSGYNVVLFRSRLDGSKCSVIASDIDDFVEIKNGYLYYINDVSALVKVRMDGTNRKKLCDSVEKVLMVKEDKIVVICIDDRASVGVFEQSVTRTVKSIYAVDFNGSGKIKPVYNIKSAKEHDEKTIYYVVSNNDAGAENPVDTLYKLDIETYQTEKLLDLEVEEKDNKMVIAMVIMAIGFFFAIIGFAAEVPFLGAIGLLAGVAGIFWALKIKAKKAVAKVSHQFSQISE